MPVKVPTAKTLSIFELMVMFPNQEAAAEYLKKVLWPNGPGCPYCGSKKFSLNKKDNQYHFCGECRKTYTIRSKTIFERSHIPLHKWLYAMYMVVTSRKGISSLQLSKEIGITQKSAWFLLQRIRAACGNQTEKILSGIVEVDETYIGGLEKNKHESKKLHAGRGPVGKTPVVGMRHRNGTVVAQVAESTDSKFLHYFINRNAVGGTTVCTDEAAAYNGLNAAFVHKTVNHSAKQYVDGMAHTNGIESVWALLKRGFYGIYHSFSEKHCQLYLDEFSFRLNEGNCKIDTVDRLNSLVKGIKGKMVTYKMLKTGVCHG